MASSNAPSNVLSQLWRNKESRGVIIQIFTMVIVFGLLAVIARNVVINLEAVGKEFSFDFLFWPAGYDIGFSPFIEYTNKSTHFMSGVVGLLNTLLIAFWGCILATILGFVIGIMRLSSNWLVSRLSYVFVEFVRNVPVL
ncbi:MAG: ABC transporter permease subunit, partial [Proteobacteria bacterium]|nr:ABC transporter permease subunit [Pseudomonadota bacterium]